GCATGARGDVGESAPVFLEALALLAVVLLELVARGREGASEFDVLDDRAVLPRPIGVLLARFDPAVDDESRAIGLAEEVEAEPVVPLALLIEELLADGSVRAEIVEAHLDDAV